MTAAIASEIEINELPEDELQPPCEYRRGVWVVDKVDARPLCGKPAKWILTLHPFKPCGCHRSQTTRLACQEHTDEYFFTSEWLCFDCRRPFRFDPPGCDIVTMDRI